MRKKIIFFLPNFSQGGAAESIVKILIDFSNKNIDCELICLNKCFYKKILIKNSVKVTEIKCNKAIYAILKIKDYLKKLSNNYKIYFVSNINYANVLSLLFFRNIKDIKIIIVERTPVQELDYNYGSLIKFIKNYLLKALIKILYAKSDLRIGNSKKVSKDFFQFTKSKFFTIYPQSIKAISKKNIFFKATNNKIKIIWVGRLDREKSFETLINALNYNFGKKIEVSVLGPGNKDFLKKKIILNKNINYKFYGYKKNLQKFFLRSDIYINTSLYEGFPNAVIQAMNYGLPVITSRSDGGILEITNNGKYATLFATKQHIELRKILIDYSLNREHYQKKACAAKINLRKFKFNNVLNAYQKKSYLYKKIRNFVKPPLFSIITVVKNNKKMLQKCFLSVDKLKLRDFEHIIVDGLSSDGTIDLIKKNKNAKNKFIIEKDEGIYDAMNKGILVATGKYIGILNSDDQYTPEALNIIKKYIKKYNSPDFIFGSVIKGRLIMSGFHPKKIFYKFNIFPSHSGSFFIKKTSQDKIGYYNTKFKYSSDYDLIFRLIKKKFIGVSTDHLEITANFFTKGISSKISFLKKINEECRIRLENKQNILFVFFLFLLQIFNKIRNVFFNKKIKRSF